MFALSRTLILLGSYSRARPHEPEIYTDAIAATLAGYAPEVIQHVTDPRTGLQRKLKWLPEVADVVEACDAEVRRREIQRDVLAFQERKRLTGERPKELEVARDPVRDAEMARKFELLLADLTAGLTGRTMTARSGSSNKDPS